MAGVVDAIESVVALPAYRQQILAGAPDVAKLNTNLRGAFFGYDFHIDDGRLGLIEINTNAGGAMLNAVLARAQRASCAALSTLVPTPADVIAFESSIVAMFHSEWHLAGRTVPLASIAIVDDDPEQQYLYPEFVLFRRLFEQHGLSAVIVDPTELDWRGGKLWHGERSIDLVYNRLTDFYLEQPGNAALRRAYIEQGVVMTPHPQAHALYADKRRLAVFSDAARLKELGVLQATQDLLLKHVPHTEIVDAEAAERLWKQRRGLFFKPASGFGSRAAYRGDKLTRRVWQEIMAGDYVAQAIVAPGERSIDAEGDVKPLKYDLRAYAYQGAVQWVSARLYQGQTTNFRTPGGGFAPVYTTTDASAAACRGCRSGDSHASYIFLLDGDGKVHPLAHSLYVALARGDATAPGWAGATLRLADWYVRLMDGEPGALLNETYNLMRFDLQGRVDWAATPSTHPHRSGVERVSQDAAWPTAIEREHMTKLLFPLTVLSNDSST
ncbi:MAG: hypothetical protein J0I65_24910 [Variovorax sp.]|nr:hypothetical protein [Variovorax sp.]